MMEMTKTQFLAGATVIAVTMGTAMAGIAGGVAMLVVALLGSALGWALEYQQKHNVWGS